VGLLTRAFSLILKRHPPRNIHQHQHQVPRLQRVVNLLQHSAIELRAGLVHPGRVYKHNLRRLLFSFARRRLKHAQNAIARGLRLGRDNGHFLAGQRIQQRAFPHVRATDNSYKS
jgi:hypothetical protein